MMGNLNEENKKKRKALKERRVRQKEIEIMIGWVNQKDDREKKRIFNNQWAVLGWTKLIDWVKKSLKFKDS